ncbi:MAG: PBP1A family penicillin-binding protein [Calditrichia bacterium]|nr:PBP1A family penicillin-binding protein [Calditrichia bacterium]
MKRRKRDATTITKFSHVEKTNNSDSKKNRKKYIYLTASFATLAAIIIYLFFLTQDLPSLTKLEQIDPALATHVYSQDGEIIKSFYTKNRSITPYEKFPEHLVQALLGTEDRKFFDHWGVDIQGIFRSIVMSIVKFEKAKGTSTLTMQLARNLNVGFGLERTWVRKIKEIFTSIQIERTYSKKEIIEMYLNINFFGSNSFGIQSAARNFFSKDVEELTVEESALLIGVLKGQSLYNPINNPERAFARRNVVLNSMLNVGYLTKTQYDTVINIPLNLDPAQDDDVIAPYFTEYIRKQLNQLQDSLGVNVYEDGLRVYTTLNTEIQKYMEQAVDSNIVKMENRARNQKALRKLKKEMSDSAFTEMTKLQIAFLCIEPENGHILAMIGGRDFNDSKWNRATQMKRQPGSAFKPFLYTAAIDNGYTPADEFYNQPVVFINPDSSRWTPKNYNEKVSGLLSLRVALRNSKNLISIRLIQEIGPRIVAQYAKRMGISTPIRPVPSLALGTSEVIPLDLVASYATFSNNGVYVKPISILRIEDKTGNVIYQQRSEHKEVLSKETAYIMTDMLQDVMKRGTGYPVRRDYKFYGPAGGKTGTTNEFTDAWFVGFTPHLVAGVWVGFDDPSLTLGSGMAGGVVALPFWGQFVKTVYDSLNFPPAEFKEAVNVLKIKICKETKKLPTPYCPKKIEELFNVKFKPTETCDVHVGPTQGSKTRRRRF